MSHKADVNIANNDGCTALYIAASKGHAGALQLLIDHGADVNVTDKEGYTPLKVARGDNVIKILTCSNKNNTVEAGSDQSFPGGSPEAILDYWEKSNKKACGNCRHFYYPVRGVPQCYVELTAEHINNFDQRNIRSREANPADCCVSHIRKV